MTMPLSIAGVPLTAASPDGAVAQIERWAGEGRGRDVHLVNAWTVALADGHDRFKTLLGDADANFADGYAVVWASRNMPTPLTQVRGPSLFRDVLNSTAPTLKHFLLGGDNRTLGLLREAIRRDHPHAVVVGAESPPFRVLDRDEIEAQDQRIRDSGATVVWVGLGTPKQDYEAQRLASVLPVVAVAVGAAFDFVAGTKSEAPGWVRRVHGEWLYRFAVEPRRLWRRYLLGNLRFLRAVHRRPMTVMQPAAERP